MIKMKKRILSAALSLFCAFGVAVPAAASARTVDAASSESFRASDVYAYLPPSVFSGNLAVDAKENPETLYLGGMNFGASMATDGVLVVGVGDNGKSGKDSPAYAAGVRTGDVILRINGVKTASVTDVTDFLKQSDGKSVKLTCLRKNAEKSFTVTPVRGEDGGYKLGVWLKDSSAGIGTVTFVDPETLAFGGLGHGISDPSGGNLLPLLRGNVTNAVITGIQKGEKGAPGEMKGYLSGDKTGTLLKNCKTGVYGVFTCLPEGCREVPVARSGEIRAGEATVITTLDGAAPTAYQIRITELHPDNGESKSFSIAVTDPRLLDKTGGIIQGMSGSPILQNGKLVGAVTHVLVKDPTRGYGILIENMLSSMPEGLK